MTVAKKYLADLTAGGLFLPEARVVAELMLNSKNSVDWLSRVTEVNILQKRSEHTALRYARTIHRRLEPLGRVYIEEVVKAHDGLYVQLLMLSAIIHTPGLADFMLEVVKESRRVYRPTITSDAWDHFIESKYQHIEGLDKISSNTLKKSGVSVVRILVEAGYLSDNRKKLLQPVYLLPETKRWLIALQREELEPVMECTL